MTLKDYYSKEKHTKKENKWYNKEMKKKFETYKKRYHEYKIEYRTRTAEKYTFKEFKEMYQMQYEVDEGRGTLRNLTDKESLVTLSEHSYEIKRENLIVNQQKYRDKEEAGIPLTEGEKLVLSVNPKDNIHKLVAFFDKLGLDHTAFDSPGSAEH